MQTGLVEQPVQSFSSDLNLRQTSFAGIISQSAAMQRIFSIIEKVAVTNSTVLILGESGTGKELIARAVHRISGRTGKMVPVNCGAIPEELLESELFGHEKGAFTGATQSRIGRFQIADGGTIFLDEIGEMSPRLQVKVLRALQERKVEPVGSARTIDVDVRVIAATNKDLKEEVKAGRFREDLYYRLQVVPIEVPALRERKGDVLVLAKYFVARGCAAANRTQLRMTAAFEEQLMSYEWSGNVRELENLMERIVIFAEGDTLDTRDLPDYIRGNGTQPLTNLIEVTSDMPSDGLDFNELVENFETRLITMALEKTSWNKKAAAKLLRLNRTTLVEKIKKKGLGRADDIDTEESTLVAQ